MKSEKMLTILILALMLCTVSTALGAVSLTVNGQDLTSIELELGKSCTVEVVSDDGVSYIAYLGFDDCVVLGDFSHLETKPEAGNLATAIEYEQPTFYGYYLSASGFSPPPSAGIHFTFEYVALQIGETDLKLYNDTFTTVIDSVNITVIELQPVAMGSAFTYQGRLSDTEGPAEGLYDFSFKLYDNPDSVFAAQQGPAVNVEDLDVVDGYFTVELDFGSSVFNGDARWLEIAVRPGETNDPNAFIGLTPRQELTPTPYALYALQTRGIFVDDAGNVGIGTTTPDALLEVEGPSVHMDMTSTSGLSPTITFDNLGSPGSVSTIGSIYFKWGVSNPVAAIHASAGSDSVNQDNAHLIFKTASQGIPIERMRINEDGNVGIGTPSPAEKLEVDGTVKAAAFVGDGSGLTGVTAINDSDWTISGINMYSAVSGNVGIGTEAPSAKLDVEVTSGGAATIGSGTNSATGDYAVAMGSSTTADGYASTAMGFNTTAGGNYSTAMGYSTNAVGTISTAIGHGATASAEKSTAMGCYTTAGGTYSTAMGYSTTAGGAASTAMGYSTTAGGAASIAMGVNTTASGNYSTAMGYEIEAAGQYSVAIALADMDGAQVTQDNTMAIMGGNVGIGTVTPGAKLDVEIAYGQGGAATIGSSTNSAAGNYAVAMGNGTNAGGYMSTAMGYLTNAGGDYSTAMGEYTTANGRASTAMGSGTTAGGGFSTAMGAATNAGGHYSTAMGFNTIASGDYSTAMGSYTTAIGEKSTAMGREIEVVGQCSVAIGLDDTYRSVTQNNTMAILGGNVGIGTASPVEKLEVDGTVQVWKSQDAEGPGLRVSRRFTKPFIGSNYTEIDATSFNAYSKSITTSGTTLRLNDVSDGNVLLAEGGGKVGIGTPTPYRRFFVNGEAGGTTAWYNDSDLRLKKDIAAIDNALEKVNKLRGVEFEWKDTENHAEGRQIGFIGQETVEVVPEVVDIREGRYSMQYAPLTALLVEAVKDLKKENDELQKQNNRLESRLSELENAMRNGSLIGKGRK